MKYTAIGSQVYVRNGRPHIRVHTIEGPAIDLAATTAVLAGIRQVCDDIQDPRVMRELVKPSKVESVSA